MSSVANPSNRGFPRFSKKVTVSANNDYTVEDDCFIRVLFPNAVNNFKINGTAVVTVTQAGIAYSFSVTQSNKIFIPSLSNNNAGVNYAVFILERGDVITPSWNVDLYIYE